MKKLIAMFALAAMLLAAACPALAEEAAEAEAAPLTTDELVGVWQATDNEALQVLILPGRYAPLPRNAQMPQLFASGAWQEGSNGRIDYYMMLNQPKQENNGFLSSLLGKSLANAVNTIRNLNNTYEEFDNLILLEYSKSSIYATWLYGDENGTETEADTEAETEVYTEDGDEEINIEYTHDGSGLFYAMRETDGSIALYWMDNYDPHAADVTLRRLTADTPSAEALNEAVLRPVIDMADGDQPRTALALMRWAADNRCMRMDGAALADSLRAAFDALEPADARAFRDNYDKISGMMLDAMSLNDQTWSSADRNAPFRSAGLGDEVSALSKDMENERAVDVLNAAVAAATGQEE